jgi:hypothetical protein
MNAALYAPGAHMAYPLQPWHRVPVEWSQSWGRNWWAVSNSGEPGWWCST